MSVEQETMDLLSTPRGRSAAPGEELLQSTESAPLPHSADAAPAVDPARYWRDYFDGLGIAASASLPVDERPATAAALADAGQGMHRLALPVDISAQLNQLTAHEGIGLSELMLAAWGLLLSKYNGEEEVLTGYACAGQPAWNGAAAAGLFAPALPLRLKLVGEQSLSAWLKQIQSTQRDHRQHSSLALSDIHRYSGAHAGQVLFDSLVTIENAASDRADIEQDPFSISNQHSRNSGLALELRAYPGEAITLELVYQAKLFEASTTRKLLEHLRQLLISMARGGAQTLAQLSLLSDEQQQRAIHDWNATQLDAPLDQSIPELFRLQVEQRGNATALVAGSARWTYRQLAARANAIANWLSARGVGAGDRVALSVYKEPDLIAAMLGIMQAGAAYVPIALDCPPERRAFIIADAGIRHTVTRRAQNDQFANTETTTLLFLEDCAMEAAPSKRRQSSKKAAPAAAANADATAYIIYTSGTTGTPKGVAITHRNLINFCTWCDSIGVFKPGDPITQFAPYTFDASAGEIFGTLTRGCELHLLANALIQDPRALMDYLVVHGIRFAAFPPPYLQQLDVERVPAGMTLLTAGSAPTLELIQQWGERCRYINGYGPTETTILSSAWMRERDASDAEQLTIGRPIANTRMYVVDPLGQLCAPGLLGEIWIGGEGVAAGYINREELTAQQFLADPWHAGGRIYRTGDLGRWLDDGRIEFVGRRDHQIKLRGFRIELGEIEAQLSRQPSIREAAVLAREDGAGDPRLVAYVVPTTALAQEPAALAAQIAAWRAELSAHLPDYMVPSAFVTLDVLPLTANGKLDRKALPAPDDSAFVRRDYEAPQGEIETIMAGLWQELLGVERVGRDDHFFELGGHSLLAVRLLQGLRRHGLGTEIRSLFDSPTLAGFAALTTPLETDTAERPLPPSAIRPDSSTITPAMLPLIDLSQAEIDLILDQVPGGLGNVQDIYALAPLQDGILFHHLLASDGDPYLQIGRLSLANRAVVERYLAAVQQVIDRHDILRTAFFWEGLSTSAQVVLRHALLHVEELSLDPKDGPIAEQLRRHCDPLHYRIALSQPPLLRIFLAHDATSDRWEMLMLMHHLIDDISSIQLLVGEIQACMTGQGDTLPPPQPFRQLVAQVRGDREVARHEAFFRSMLADVDEPAAPLDLKTAQASGDRLLELRRHLPSALNERLRAQARRLGVSLGSLCHLAWGQVLARTSGKDSVVFGTILFGRMQAGDGAERIMGPCINTLPVRLDLAQASVEDSVRLTHARLAELLGHEHATLALAQRCSGVAVPTPLFSTLLNYRHNRPLEAGTAQTITLDGIDWQGFEERTNYPITISVDDAVETLGLSVQVVEALSPQRIYDYMQQALESLAQALESTPRMPVSQLDVLPLAERTLLLDRWNATDAAYPAQACVHQLFEQQVERAPAAPALHFDGQTLSYAQLNAQANRLAHHLIALGVRPDDRVAICVERGISMVVGLLAILKAGGAYVPLDPAYPAERLAYILGDAAPGLLLSDARGRAAFEESALAGLTVLNLDAGTPAWSAAPEHNPEVQGLDPRHLAYVIYTSGSTGQPKGVMVEHRGVVNFLQAMLAIRKITDEDRLLAITSISFDIAGLELYLPLSNGAQVVLASYHDSIDPHALQSLLSEHQISVMQATPTTWRALLDAHWKKSPGLTILCGGEALPADLATRLHDHGHALWNLYGPTETTIWSSIREVREQDKDAYSQSIGRPIANTTIYLLDSRGQPVPLGAVGELYIGGHGVARGYFNRPDLTAERFVPDPFSSATDARMYKTGDLARYLPDGSLVFLGRNDHQIKIRGFRIELGEIEARLLEHPSVREAAVMARKDVAGESQLVGYVVPRPIDETSRDADAGTGTRFSLFFFGADSRTRENKYRLYLESAKFADQHQFEAVWTPERHFHTVGNLYPNPATLNAALATLTSRVKLRAGSVVLPLHDPIRVAEEWSIVDNLSNGRVGIAAASGWHPRDFSLLPDNFANRKQVMAESIQTLRTLWKGESITRRSGSGEENSIRIYPDPVQAELPIWVTAAGNPDTFAHAGKIGANVLTHLLGQKISDLAVQIAHYRATREKAGFDPKTGRVTVMIHTFVGGDLQQTLDRARKPFMNYMQEHIGLLSEWVKSLGINIDDLSSKDRENVVEFAFERYTRSASLIGTPQGCLTVANQLQDIGVDEIACLLDWMDAESALEALPHLNELYELTRSSFNRGALRGHLQSRLPDYMVPAAFVTLDALPLTPNGKIDRKALPAPDDTSFIRRAYEAPQGPIETTLAELWQELLGVERVGRHDHFFELGGYSLLAVRLIERLRRAGLSMEIRTLFEKPTLAELATRTIELTETRL